MGPTTDQPFGVENEIGLGSILRFFNFFSDDDSDDSRKKLKRGKRFLTRMTIDLNRQDLKLIVLLEKWSRKKRKLN